MGSLRSMDLVNVRIKDRNGRMQAVSRPTTLKILEAAFRDECWVESACSATVEYDLSRMKRRTFWYACTQEEVLEDIIIEIPWNAKIMATLVDQDESLRREVLEMVIHRIRREDILKGLLATKGLPNCLIRENPYLRSGHTPFENFIESMLTTFSQADDPTGKHYRKLLGAASDNLTGEKRISRLEKGGIKVVFHGTNHGVMDKILFEGLNPSLRRRDLNVDFFGIHYLTSREYSLQKTPGRSYGSYKLLVFMVICKFAGEIPYGAMTLASNKQQLPVAEITVTAL